jgi:integrase
MKAVPLNVIAAQLGHSDIRMTEKHYAHLAPSRDPGGSRLGFRRG